MFQFIEWNSILNFFGYGSSDDTKQDEARRARPASPSVESEADKTEEFKMPDPPTTSSAAPCTPTGVIINVPSPSPNAIQNAINAANPSGGDTIQVGAGTYIEQLVVNKCVTIIGNGQANTIIQSPNTLALSAISGVTNTASIVEVRSNSYVKMTNLTVTGPVPFTNTVYGIFVAENATLEMDNTRITAIHKLAGIDGVQNGNAVRAGSVQFNLIGSIDFDNVTIDDYQKNAIIVSRAGSNGIIANSTITGIGPTAIIGQNGVQVSGGATATITNNTISGHEYTPNTVSATGVLPFDSGAVTVSGNTLSGNDVGVYHFTTAVPGTLATLSVTNNTFTNSPDAGIIFDAITPTITDNFISGSNWGIGGFPVNGQTVQINRNSITAPVGANSIGIYLDDYDTGSPTTTATVNANFTRISGHTAGLQNDSASMVNAENNFWGCNGGSGGGIGCDPLAGTGIGLIDADPWLKLSNTTTSTPSVNAGGTSTIGANLRVNSNNVNTFTMNNHLPNPIPSTPTSLNSPNGIPVSFSVNNPAYGSVSPTTAPLSNGLASTTFTGGTVDGGDKIAVVTAQVDNATNSVNVTVLDTIAPTVLSAVGSQGSPTVVNYLVTFSEAVNGVDATDFTLTPTGNVVASITGVTGSGNTRTVQITIASGMGTINLNIVDDDSIVDTASALNPLSGTGAGNGNFTGTPFAVDVQMPTVTINQKTSAPAQSDPTSSSPINFTVVFNEPVTGFATGDVTIATGVGTAFGVGSTPSAVVTGSGTTYNVAVSGMNKSGTVTATIAANVAVDNVGNPNTASTSTDNTVTFNLVNTAVTVNPTNTNTAGITMWGGFNDVTNALTPPSYVVGPMTPPLGTGSARLNTTATGKYLFFSTAFNSAAALPLSQITELSYSSYAVDPSNAANLPSLQIGIDYSSIDANTGFQGRLVFEPANNTTAPNQPTAQNQWQTWSATNGNFWFTSAPGNVACGQATPCSLATILATYPTINIPNTAFGFIGFRSTGGGVNAVENYVDNFMIGVNSANTTFNFEAQPPTISIGNATVTEGDSGTTTATFTITQSVASQLATTVTVNTADGATPATAATAPSDYAALVNQTATIAPGSTTTTVTVNVNGDNLVEPNETFTVNLSNAVNAAIVTGSGTGTITNDDAVPTVMINQASGQADPTNVSPINFTVVFNTPVTGFATGDVSFAGSTAGGTLVGTVTGSGTTYNVAVTGMTSSGTVIASIPLGVANDGAGNPNAASTSTDNSVTYFTTTAAMIVDDDGQADLGPGGTPNCNATTPAPNLIQTAIDLSLAGGTIYVCPGTYVEELNINKQLTLLGPNANVNPNTGPARNPSDPNTEAIIVPTTVGNPVDPTFAGPLVVFLGADGITFSGFTVDGNNPALTSGVIFNGQDVDAEFGIYGTQTANPDAIINNNIVQNIGEIAVWVTSNNVGGPKDANSSIFDNKVDNVLGAFGQAIRISEGAWVDVKTNVVTRSRVGITIENYYPGNTGTHPASEISDNNISAFRIGIRHNLHYNYTAPGFTIRHNTVNSYVQAVRPPEVIALETPVNRYQGIRLESIQNGVPVNVFDNILTGNRAAMIAAGYTENSGLYVTNASTNSANMLLTGNSVTDFIRGANNETPAVPTFNCNNFFGNTTGVYLSSAATNGLTAANNNIIGNGFGMQNDGPANVNAQSNYWGAANGPGPVGPGNGDNVSTNIDFSNFLTAQATCAIVVPKTFPTVTINQVGPDPTNTQPINFTVVFSEAVTGFTSSDVVLSGTAGNIGGATITVTGGPSTYNVAVSGLTTDGTVIANVPVGAAQSVTTSSPTSASTSTDNTVTYDTLSPTVMIEQASGQNDPTNASPINFTVVFSEPTTNFATGDVSFTGSTAGGTLVGTVSGSGTTYNVAVTGMTSSGTVIASIGAGVATDAAGNGNAASTSTDNTVTYDITAPTVTINQAAGQGDPTSSSPINFTVVFNEPVTGFATGDVTIATGVGTAFGVGSTPSAVVTGSGTTYNVAVSGMNKSGTVTATIAANVAVDNVGNPNTASTSTDNTVTFNLVNTAVTVNPTNTNTAGITMWGGFNDVTNALTPPSYVVGPMTPPLGTGSARLNTTATGKYLFFSTAFNSAAALPLSQITELSYSSYAVDPSNAANLPSLQIGIDYSSIDANTGFQGRLVFEPANNTTAPNQPTAQNQWQTWSATNGNFWFTSAPGNVACGQATPCSLATILATYPTINIPNTAFGFIGFRSTGGGVNAVENYVDNFMIGVNSANTTFNFEAQPPTISIGNATVTEGDSGTTTATFTITQSVASQLATTVTVNTADGATPATAATAPSDYAALVNQTATIAPGSTTTTVTVNVNGDNLVEPNETFTVNLSNAVNAAIVTGSGTGTITNDDAFGTLQFSSATYSVTEGTPTASITVTRTGGNDQAVSVSCSTVAGGTATAGSDYTATIQTISFADQDSANKTCSIPITNDNISEPAETVNLSLSGVVGAAIGSPSSAVLTINDSGNFILISGNIQQYNAPSPNTNLAGVTVTLSGSASGTTTTDANGNYTFNGGLPSGTNNYLVVPSLAGKVFDPTDRSYVNLTSNVTNANFVAYNTGAVPRNVRVVNTSQATYTSNVTVPIVLDSLGTENGLSFSLNYNPLLLDYSSITCGADAPGCSVSVTDNSGMLGVEFTRADMPVNVPTAFTAGNGRQVVLVTFTTTPGAAFNTPVTFGDSPAIRDVNDVDGNSVPTNYVNGQVIFAQGIEGDVAGRTTGNGSLTSNDVTILRQFVSGALTPDPNFNEFQRADVAPAGSKGGGTITSADVTVLRNYIANSTITPAGGPNTPISMLFADGEVTKSKNRSIVATALAPGDVRIVSKDSSAGSSVSVPIQLQSAGNENGVTVSVQFESSKLVFTGAVPGPDLASQSNTTFDTNVTQLASGRVGVSLTLNVGQTFPAGNRNIIVLNFNVKPNAPVGLTPISFVNGNMPLDCETNDTMGNVLSVYPNNFIMGNVNVLPPTAANVSVGGKVINASGNGIVGANVTIISGTGESRVVRTNSFGNYEFKDVRVGEIYTVRVGAKKYSFAADSRTISVIDSLADVDFTADN